MIRIQVHEKICILLKVGVTTDDIIIIIIKRVLLKCR